MRRVIRAILTALVLLPAVDPRAAWAQPATPTPVCQPQNLGNTQPVNVFGSTTAAPALFAAVGCRPAQTAMNPERAFLYTPPLSGLYQIDTFGSSYDTVLYVRQGTCAGIELGCNDDQVDVTSSSVLTLELTAGLPVVIFVDGFSGAGDFALHIALASSLTPTPTQTPPFTRTPTRTSTRTNTPLPTFTPTSLPCMSQNLGSAVPATAFGSTTGAPALFAGTCRPEATAPTSEKVFLFTPATSGRYEIDTLGTSFDSVLYVRQGSCSGNEIACNDDADPPARHSRVALELTSGVPIAIFVDGFSTGDFTLHITLSPSTPTPTVTPTDTPTPPGGGTPTQSPTVTPTVPCQVEAIENVLPLVFMGSTMGSSKYTAPCRPGISGQSPERVLLYTPPTTGLYQIDTFGSAFDTILYVRRTNCSGMEIGCSDDEVFSLQSLVNVELTQGMPIVIFVDGYSGALGNFKLSINLSSALTPTPTVTPRPPVPVGDCDADMETTIIELQSCINQFLAGEVDGFCRACDSNDDLDVSIVDVQAAVNCFLDATSNDCPRVLPQSPD